MQAPVVWVSLAEYGPHWEDFYLPGAVAILIVSGALVAFAYFYGKDD